MKSRYSFALGLALLLSCLLGVGQAATAAGTSPAPQKKTAPAKRPANLPAMPELPQDPALRMGKLRNGLRYAIYPNKQPEGRASLRLLVRAGSRTFWSTWRLPAARIIRRGNWSSFSSGWGCASVPTAMR